MSVPRGDWMHWKAPFMATVNETDKKQKNRKRCWSNLWKPFLRDFKQFYTTLSFSKATCWLICATTLLKVVLFQFSFRRTIPKTFCPNLWGIFAIRISQAKCSLMSVVRKLFVFQCPSTHFSNIFRFRFSRYNLLPSGFSCCKFIFALYLILQNTTFKY